MKTIITVLLLAAVVNILAWLFVDAWDREETTRIERNKQYIEMLRNEAAANERR